MKTCILSPYSRAMRNGKRNPKNYPYFKELIKLLKDKGYHTIQVGIHSEEPIGADEFKENCSFAQLEQMCKKCDIFISVDNFFQHLAAHVGKSGIVLFGQSDPEIFGHKIHKNMLKDRKYLRANQFATWEECEYNEDAFVKPEEIINEL